MSIFLFAIFALFKQHSAIYVILIAKKRNRKCEKMNDQELLARKIVSIRNSQDMSQLELAQKANIKRTALNKIEKGTRKISSDELKRIALALHQSSDDLLNINNHVKTTNTVTESSEYDLNRMIDNARFFDGKPIDDHDKDLVRGILKRIYNEK